MVEPGFFFVNWTMDRLMVSFLIHGCFYDTGAGSRDDSIHSDGRINAYTDGRTDGRTDEPREGLIHMHTFLEICENASKRKNRKTGDEI